MTTPQFPEILREYVDGPGWDVIAIQDLDLELYEEWNDDWMSAWGIEDEAQTMLWSFAQEGAGGRVCLWTYDDQAVDQAPVVHIDSEGGCSMLAGDIEEFIALTVVGLDPFKIAYSIDGLTAQSPADEGAQFLADHNVDIPESVSDLIDAAIEAHPDIEEWIYSHLNH